jgi:DHA1 family inner membrane transport protein
MTMGNIIVPKFADRALMPTAAALLLGSAAALASIRSPRRGSGRSASQYSRSACRALGAILQTRLMDVAGDAQGLAAALNHSAFNTANALGPPAR